MVTPSHQADNKTSRAQLPPFFLAEPLVVPGFKREPRGVLQVPLINSIMPIITGAIAKGAVKPVGTEDREEMSAEGCALAACMIDSAEREGKVLNAHSVAHYALQSLKSGRRSG
jgi:hypothetical protein